ncbi:MAG: esterase-like activity of phytase family protein [Kiritimatiellae bacterium]|nr:esterase-like activity of phytase family protein [Kiritimatiellia bacterium]
MVKALPLVALALLAGCATRLPLPTLEPIGEFALADDAPEGLSAITWMGDDRYAMAEDSGGRIHFARIEIDSDTGAITNCVFTGVRTVPGLADAEGIAYDPSNGILYVSDESGPKVLLLREEGEPQEILFPEFFKQVRGNKSLEALDLETGDGGVVLWAANEDALRCDGPVSSATNSSLVRIAAFPPITTKADAGSWWFYALDHPVGKAIPGLNRHTPFTGVADIASLGCGRLLVLERSCGLIAEEDGSAKLITISIHLVDTSSAKPGKTLGKHLIWAGSFDRSNYEGIALGPRLADGSRCVLLVADGDVMTARIAGHEVSFPWRKALFALRLQE